MNSIAVKRISGLDRIGGYGNIEAEYQKAIPSVLIPNSTCGMPREDAFHVLRALDADFPWPSMILQCGVASAWYWICDQVKKENIIFVELLTWFHCRLMPWKHFKGILVDPTRNCR